MMKPVGILKKSSRVFEKSNPTFEVANLDLGIFFPENDFFLKYLVNDLEF